MKKNISRVWKLYNDSLNLYKCSWWKCFAVFVNITLIVTHQVRYHTVVLVDKCDIKVQLINYDSSYSWNNIFLIHFSRWNVSFQLWSLAWRWHRSELSIVKTQNDFLSVSLLKSRIFNSTRCTIENRVENIERLSQVASCTTFSPYSKHLIHTYTQMRMKCKHSFRTSLWRWLFFSFFRFEYFVWGSEVSLTQSARSHRDKMMHIYGFNTSSQFFSTCF